MEADSFKENDAEIFLDFDYNSHIGVTVNENQRIGIATIAIPGMLD